MKIDEISAYPSSGGLTPQPGATLRDFFAAHALIGIIAISDQIASDKCLSKLAFDEADKMMEARKT